jgi:hypothetical protein
MITNKELNPYQQSESQFKPYQNPKPVNSSALPSNKARITDLKNYLNEIPDNAPVYSMKPKPSLNFSTEICIPLPQYDQPKKYQNKFYYGKFVNGVPEGPCEARDIDGDYLYRGNMKGG